MSKKSEKLLITGADYEIAKMQLERLKMIAEARLLSLEEAKIYDILVRNLKVAKNDPEETQILLSEQDKLLLAKKDEELINIALGTMKLVEIKDSSDE
jgi:hypothetical protein